MSETFKIIQGTVHPFMRDSTIGGLNNSARSNNHAWSVYWIIIFTVGTILTSIQINQIVKDYLVYDVAVTNTLSYQSALKFPAVTVCNVNRVNCLNLYILINNTMASTSDSNSTSSNLLIQELQAMLVQVGCDQQICEFSATGLSQVRENDFSDWAIILLAVLQCQNIFDDPARQYFNENTCYYLWQMLHYDSTYASDPVTMAENQQAWESANCTLESACDHYIKYIMPLVNSGVFSAQYMAGDEIMNDCAQYVASNTTGNRRKRQAIPDLNQAEATYTYNISWLENQFLPKYMELDESVRIMIGHQFANFILSEALGYQQGMVTTCTFLGVDCKDETLWYQFNDPTYGNCFTFNSANNKSGSSNITSIRNATLTGASNGLQIELYVDQTDYMMKGLTQEAGLKIVIHDPFSYPLLDDYGIDLAPGFLTSIAVQLTNISRLADPYVSHCIDYWNQTNFDPSVMTEEKPQYSMSDCNRFCLQLDIISNCDCYHIQLDMTLINISRVNFANGSRPCALLPTTDNLDYPCFQNVLKSYENQVKQCTTCKLACITLALYEQQYDDTQLYDPTISTSIQQIIQQNYLKVEIYYQTLNVQQVTESALISGSDLYAGLGGALALYLGIAIIMFFELIQLIVLISLNLFHHYREKKEEQKKLKTTGNTVDAYGQSLADAALKKRKAWLNELPAQKH